MQEEEAKLLALLQEQPEQGLAQAIARYGGTVRWIVRKIVGSGQAEIEECTADVFVRLWQHANRFDKTRGTALSAWLYGIARHVALDYRRRKMQWKDTIPLEESALALTLDLEDSVAQKANAQILRETVDALPRPDREIFLYRYFFELPVKEIAAQLGLSAKQVENRLYRGRLTLRKQLEERGVMK